MIELMQGDCLEKMDELIKRGVKVDAIICDPPYNTTHNEWDSLINFNELWPRLDAVIKDNGAVVLFGAEPFSSQLRLSNIKNYRYDWIWQKDNGTGFLNAKKQPLKIYETISVFYKKQPTYNPQMRQGFASYKCKQGSGSDNYNYGKSEGGHITESNGERYPINILKYDRDPDVVHPTQKPVELMEYLILTYTQEGDTVLDFTMGSGSTGVGALMARRNFIGIERDPHYFAIAEKRIKDEQAQGKLF